METILLLHSFSYISKWSGIEIWNSQVYIAQLVVYFSIKFLCHLIQYIYKTFPISEKKRLIDSRTISNDYQGWVEFNVITSLNFWLHHTNKNFGFDVEVEDAYGNKLNPNLYFQNINCSYEIRKFISMCYCQYLILYSFWKLKT